jgi:hypothetical protein
VTFAGREGYCRVNTGIAQQAGVGQVGAGLVRLDEDFERPRRHEIQI